jgi:hypothetical protein
MIKDSTFDHYSLIIYSEEDETTSSHAGNFDLLLRPPFHAIAPDDGDAANARDAITFIRRDSAPHPRALEFR